MAESKTTEETTMTLDKKVKEVVKEVKKDKQITEKEFTAQQY